MYRLLPLLLVLCPAFAANLTLNSTVTGTVRLATDAINVNRFASSTGVITNTNPPSPEFTGAVTISGVPVTLTADFNRFDNSIAVAFGLVNVSDAITVPQMIFSFSGLQFTPFSILTGATINGGTPGYFNLPVITGPDSFTISTTGAGFLSNGGSAAFSYYLQPTEVPEPATLSLLGVAAGVAAALRLARRQ